MLLYIITNILFIYCQLMYSDVLLYILASFCVFLRLSGLYAPPQLPLSRFYSICGPYPSCWLHTLLFTVGNHTDTSGTSGLKIKKKERRKSERSSIMGVTFETLVKGDGKLNIYVNQNVMYLRTCAHSENLADKPAHSRRLIRID